MDVYLVPVGPERYELYCESAEDAPVAHEESSSGVVRRMQQRFGQVLAAVEHEHERERSRFAAHRRPHDSALRRLRARVVRWLAERVAEQRLLWRLRGQRHVRALYPTPLDDARALSVIRRTLEHDGDYHARWLVLDAVGLVVSGLVAPVPGPNLLAYYFTFRVVGHFLAFRGARHGVRSVEWQLQANPLLGDLAALDGVPVAARLDRVREVERELGLTRLARFYERVASGTA
jgi:hypothetical protein